MLIAQISDSHIELPEPNGAGRIRDLERVIYDINALGEQPDLVIHTGDITHCDRPLEYKFVKSVMGRLKVPWYVIPGNKDRRQPMMDVFGMDGPFIQQTLDKEQAALVLLDTLSNNSNKGAMCDDRLAWLKAELERLNGKPVLIFMHHPSYEMTGVKYPFQFETHQMADAFNELVSEANSQIKGIFCGHSHRNTYGDIGSVPAMTVTALALDRRKGEYPAEMEGRPVYQLIRVAKDGSFEANFQICR